MDKIGTAWFLCFCCCMPHNLQTDKLQLTFPYTVYKEMRFILWQFCLCIPLQFKHEICIIMSSYLNELELEILESTITLREFVLLMYILFLYIFLPLYFYCLLFLYTYITLLTWVLCFHFSFYNIQLNYCLHMRSTQMFIT